MAYAVSRSTRAPPISSSYDQPRDVRSREEDSDDDSCNDDDKDHACLMYAQKLNNNAAMCIEIGYYEKATQSLQRALEFSQRQSDDSLVDVCDCAGCKVDGNIDFSADFAPKDSRRQRAASRPRYNNDSSEDDDDILNERPTTTRSMSRRDITKLTKSISNPKVKKLSIEELKSTPERGKGKNASWSIADEYCDEELETSEYEDNEIYKRPIRILREGHPMGSTLFLVITFNLALTHHLEVAAARNQKRHSSKSAMTAHMFYALANSYESRMVSDPNSSWDSLSSIRFNTILTSNVNQLLPFLPEKSLPSVRDLVSKVVKSIDAEMRLLSGRSSRRPKSSGDRKSRNKGGRSEGSVSSSSKSSTMSGTSSRSNISSRSNLSNRSKSSTKSNTSSRSNRSSSGRRSSHRSKSRDESDGRKPSSSRSLHRSKSRDKSDGRKPSSSRSLHRSKSRDESDGRKPSSSRSLKGSKRRDDDSGGRKPSSSRSLKGSKRRDDDSGSRKPSTMRRKSLNNALGDTSPSGSPRFNKKSSAKRRSSLNNALGDLAPGRN